MNQRGFPMLPKLEPRTAPSTGWVYSAPLLAITLTLLAGGLLFGGLGYPPLQALSVFFLYPLSSADGIAELLVKAIPLCLIAIGLSVGFRANVWNIGAEGQLTLGAIVGSVVGLTWYDNPAWWVLPLMLLGGIVGGMAWAAIPALLRASFNASEILVSLMLTYVGNLVLIYLVHGPLRDPMGYNFPKSKAFPDEELLPILLEGSRLHAGLILALVAVVVAWFVMDQTLAGFRLKVIGEAPVAGGYAGFSHKRAIWASLLTSGGLAGLAGVIEITGPIGQLQPAISPGYGFTAIIVAFLGRLHPLGIALASLLVALSYLGGESVQMQLHLPIAVTGVFQGLLLFFLLGADVLIRYRVRWPKRLERVIP